MRSILIALLFVSGVFVAPALAQPDMFDDDRRPRGGDPAMMRQRIEDLRKLKLMDILALQGDQVEKFFAAYNPQQKATLEAKDAMDAASRAVWEATERKAPAAELDQLLVKLQSSVTALQRAVEARQEAVRKVLSTEQYARYVVFEVRFRDELDKMIIKRMRDGGRDGGRGRDRKRD